jgi:hypothetical protein
VPDKAFRSPRAARLLCSAVLMLALCAVAATASAAAAHAGPAIARSAQSQQRAQARAERKLERQARKLQKQAARQAQRSTRQAEREQRHATRQAERSERAGAADSSAEAPTQSEATPPEAKSEAPKTGGEAQPAATGHGPCTLTAQASSAQVTAGDTVTISGKVSCPSPAGDGEQQVTEQQVTVYQRGPTSATPGLNTAGTVTSQADGSYTFQSAQLTGRSVFIVRSASARHAARVIVSVTGAISLQGPASGASLPMAAGHPDTPKQTFAGTLAPEEAGRQVALRVRYGSGEWRTVAFTRTDDAGHFAFSHRFRYAGDISVMATASTRGTQRTQSPVLTYAVAQAENPALTIAGSSALPVPTPGDALVAGEPTTLSGVAAGGPHQTVTLLSRTSGGRFTAIATVQSDESGAYSFTVSPTETTVYMVTCAKQRSSQLRVQPASAPAAPAS